MTITAGTPKQRETYAEQVRNHEDPGKQVQAAKDEWRTDTRDTPERKGHRPEARSGSESNAS